MRVSKDVVNAIQTKINEYAQHKIKSIPKPKHSSEKIKEDLQKYVQTEMMKMLPTLLNNYQKKHSSIKFNVKYLCDNTSFGMLDSWRFTSFVKLEEECEYEDKIATYQNLRNSICNDVIIRLPFIKTQKEYDEYLLEVEKQFK